MKTILQIALWIVCGFLGYLIYTSINAPIEFKKVRNERYSAAIAKLKDIKNAQEAHKIVTGKYASKFDGLVKFIDTADYTITQQRDSSFMRYSKEYGIDVQIDTVVIDTLGTVKVKDSLFKNSDRFKSIAKMTVPGTDKEAAFEMKSDILDVKGFKSPVFEASVKKDLLLYDQPEDLRDQENAHESIEEVNGDAIIVGSLSEVSTSGNWPSIYDRKKSN